MKRLLVIAVLLVAAVVPGSASASDSGRPVSGRLSATITDVFGNCCFTFDDFEGHARIRGLGRVSFTGEGGGGCTPFEEPPVCSDELLLTITTRSGATLDLASRVNWVQTDPEPPLEWTVTAGTGRFAGASGAGAFEDVSVDRGAGTRSFRLVGRITRGDRHCSGDGDGHGDDRDG